MTRASISSPRLNAEAAAATQKGRAELLVCGSGGCCCCGGTN
jgi:hypothetical protein